MVNFEVGKSTKHHKSGIVFHSDCLINIDGQKFYASSDKEDIYQAIDEIRETLFGKLEKIKIADKLYSDVRASSVKKMLKGLSKRNPLPRNTKC